MFMEKIESKNQNISFDNSLLKFFILAQRRYLGKEGEFYSIGGLRISLSPSSNHPHFPKEWTSVLSVC